MYQVIQIGQVIGEYDSLSRALEVAAEINDEDPDCIGDGAASVYNTTSQEWVRW